MGLGTGSGPGKGGGRGGEHPSYKPFRTYQKGWAAVPTSIKQIAAQRNRCVNLVASLDTVDSVAMVSFFGALALKPRFASLGG
jgi:hypothetical protein